MKTNLLILFLALLLQGCRKEKEIVNGSLVASGNGITHAQRINPENMEDAMNAFITLTIRNTLQDCNDYEAQDALLIMEGALNYHTCTPDSVYDETAMDTISFEIFTTKNQNGEFIVLNDSMESLWPRILEGVENTKSRVSFDNPFNIVVDLEFTEFDPGSGQDVQTAVIKVVTQVGNVIIYPVPDRDCNWDSGDEWIGMGPMFTYSGGYGCGANVGNTSSWAIRELQKKLSPLCREICDGNYLSNVSIKSFSYDENNPGLTSGCFFDIQFPNYSFLWFNTSQFNCLDSAELACETDGIKYLAANYPLSGKVPISYQMLLKHNSAIYPYYYYHMCIVYYAKCSLYD